MKIEGDSAQYLAEIANVAPTQKRHTLDFINSMEYAEPLHNRHGYYVFRDSQHPGDNATQWIQEAFDRYGGLTNQHMEMALSGAGYEEIAFLRSYTNEMRPPVKAGEGPRAAHPGGWADVTNNLRNAYRHEVNGKRA